MNDNKQLSYKVWLDELNTAPPEAFFTTFRQFYDLLLKENPIKIEIIREKVDEETRRLVNSGNEAIKDLEPLLNLIEEKLKNRKNVDLSQIDHYRKVKNREIKIMGEDLPDTLYHAIRLTIEKHRNMGLLKDFDDKLLNVNNNFWYLDYAKVCEAYPKYKQFKDTKEAFGQKEKEEPWGAVIYLSWAKGFFKDILPEQAGSFVKTDIVNNLRKLILFLLTPEVAEGKSPLEKLSFINLLKIYDVLLDIEEKAQITQEETFIIALHPHLIRFTALFPADSISMRKRYIEFRWDAFNYLKKISVIVDFTLTAKGQGEDSEIKLTIKPSKFQEILLEARKLYTSHKKEEKQPKEQIQPDKNIEKEPKIVYRITYTKTREILLNEAIRLSRPDFDSENEIVFDYLYKNPNIKITKAKIENETKREISKSFHKIVENLGFKNDLKQVFFQVSKDTILFRNPITEDDLSAMDITKIKLP